MAKKLEAKAVRQDVLDAAAFDKIELLIKSTFHGSITAVVQDSCIIQIERNEMIRTSDLLNKLSAINKDGSPGVRSRLLESITGLKYGQIVVVIKNGAVVQIEKTEKSRLTGWQGQYGEVV